MKDFPLLARICIHPGFDMPALRRAGYNNADGYFSGNSRFNRSVVGWAGHTQDGKVVGKVEEIYDAVKQNVSLKNHYFYVQVTTLSGRKVTLDIDDIVQEEPINYPDNCQTLDVTKEYEMKMEGVKDIQINFKVNLNLNILPNISISVDLLGKSSACIRNLAEFAFSQSGERIVFGHFLDKRYAIKIFGDQFVEEDPGNDCRNYPNEDFLSYKDCDQDYMKKEVDRISPGLNPVWLSDHLSQATPRIILQNARGKFIRVRKC